MDIGKVKLLTEELLEKMKIQGNANVVEKEGVIQINIESEDSGLLIGYHAETLQSLQRILAMLVNQGASDWRQIIVDVGEYRKQREEALKRMARRAARQARELGEEQELPSMSSFERRLIHIFLTEENGVTSESRGEGRHRRVIVKPE